jgi:hypothetical protein
MKNINFFKIKKNFMLYNTFFFLEKRIKYKKYDFLNDFVYKKNLDLFTKTYLNKVSNIDINLFLKKQLKIYKFKIKYFYVCLKKTQSNFFFSFMNYKNCFISMSLGQTGYKGPIKTAIDAYEDLG